MSLSPSTDHRGALGFEEHLDAARDVVLLRHNAIDDDLQSSPESASPSPMGPEFQDFEASPEIDVTTDDVEDDHHGLFVDLEDGGLLQGLNSVPATDNSANSINSINLLSSANAINSVNSAESPCHAYDPRFTACHNPAGYGQMVEQGESAIFQRQNSELSALLASAPFDPEYTRPIIESPSPSTTATAIQGSIWRPTPWQANCEAQLFNMERCVMQNPVNHSLEERGALPHDNTVIDLTESTDSFPSEDHDSDLNFNLDPHQHQQQHNIAPNTDEIIPFQVFDGCAPVTQCYQVEKQNQAFFENFPFPQRQNIDKSYLPTSYPDQSQQFGSSSDEFIHDWPKFQQPLGSLESAGQAREGCDFEEPISSAVAIQDAVTIEPTAVSDVALAAPRLFNPGPVRFDNRPQSVPQVELTNRDLWLKFFEIGTEMIITKAGRRMFPAVKLNIKNLDPNKNYALAIDILPVDNNRYRYVYHSSQWMAAGTTEASAAPCTYFHPDSPARGDVWMQQAISFDKLKLTNHEMNRKGHVILHSMHKYQPRVHLIECAITRHSELEHLVAPNRRVDDVTRDDVTTTVFPECAFTTVTAYQNQQITKLKIDRNPFAKGFRDNSKNWKPKAASDENKLKRSWNGEQQAPIHNNTNTPRTTEHSGSPSTGQGFMSNYQTIPVPDDFNQRDLYEPEQKLLRTSSLNVPNSHFDPQHNIQDLSMIATSAPGNAPPYPLGGFPIHPEDPTCFTSADPNSTQHQQQLDYSSAYSVSSYGSLESTNSLDDQLAFPFQPVTPATIN